MPRSYKVTKLYKHGWAVGSCLLGGLLAVSTAHAEPMTVDFADAEDLERFVEAGGRDDYVHSTQPGVGGAPGRLDANVAGDATTLYYRDPVDLNQGSLEISYYFLARAYSPGNVSRVALGLWENTEQNFVGRSHFQLRLVKGGSVDHARLEVRNAEDGEATRNVQLHEGHWYRLSARIQHVDEDRFQVEGQLEHMGEDGVSPADQPVARASGIYTNDELVNDEQVKPLHVGVLLQSDAGGAVALDDLRMAGDALAGESQ